MELLLGAEESGARGDGAQKASEARRRVQAPEKLSASDRTQLLVWLVWLLELFLNEMALLRDRSAAPPPPAAGVVASAATLGESAKYKQVEAEFRQFLASPPILVRNSCSRFHSQLIGSLVSSKGTTSSGTA